MGRRFSGAVGILVALVAACGDDGGQTPSVASPPADEVLADLTSDGVASLDELYVGVDGERHIAVGLRGDTAIAYICDGDELGRWLEGSVDDGQVTLADADGTVSGRLDEGELHLDGESGAIVLTPADDDDGLLRLAAGGGSVGGLVIVDGASRGRMQAEVRGTASFTVAAGTESVSAVTLESVRAQDTLDAAQQVSVLAERVAELAEGGTALEGAAVLRDQQSLREALERQLAELSAERDEALAELAEARDRALEQLAARSATPEQVAALEELMAQIRSSLEEEYARLVAEIQAMLAALDAQLISPIGPTSPTTTSAPDR
jgi:hypothetical protein